MQISERMLIDGATGTELDRRGVDVTLPLWSARALIDAPEVLYDIHRDYLEAGARALTTNTFRTQARSLKQGGAPRDAGTLTREAVVIAQQARDDIAPDALVMGSVAPLEDCYRPDLAPDINICRAEHGAHIEHLVDAGADLVLIETMCAAPEAMGAAQAARERAPGDWAISFCFRHEGSPGVLLDGTPFDEILPHIEDALFIGVNCVSALSMVDHVRHLAHLVGDRLPIAAWGNVGHPDPVKGWTNTDATDPCTYAALAMDWLGAGASIVGGCCGTSPATIAAVHDAINEDHTLDRSDPRAPRPL